MNCISNSLWMKNPKITCNDYSRKRNSGKKKLKVACWASDTNAKTHNADAKKANLLKKRNHKRSWKPYGTGSQQAFFLITAGVSVPELAEIRHIYALRVTWLNHPARSEPHCSSPTITNPPARHTSKCPQPGSQQMWTHTWITQNFQWQKRGA